MFCLGTRYVYMCQVMMRHVRICGRRSWEVLVLQRLERALNSFASSACRRLFIARLISHACATATALDGWAGKAFKSRRLLGVPFCFGYALCQKLSI